MPQKDITTLHQGLVEEGLYTKDFETFRSQYSDRISQAKLHSGLKELNLYTKDLNSFRNQYFSDVEPQKKREVDGEDGGTDSGTRSFGDVPITGLGYATQRQRETVQAEVARREERKELAKTEFEQRQETQQARDADFGEQLGIHAQRSYVQKFQEHRGMEALRARYRAEADNFFAENPNATEEDYDAHFKQRYERQLTAIGNQVKPLVDEEVKAIAKTYQALETAKMGKLYNEYEELAEVSDPISTLILTLKNTFSRMPDQAKMTDAVMANIHTKELEQQQEQLAGKLELIPEKGAGWTEEQKQAYTDKYGPIDETTWGLYQMDEAERKQITDKLDNTLKEKQQLVTEAGKYILEKRAKEGKELKEHVMVEQLKDIENPLDVINYVASATGEGLAQIPASILTLGMSSLVVEAGEIYADQLQQVQEQKSAELGREVTVEEIIENEWDDPERAFMFGAMAAGLDRVGAGQVLKSVGKKYLRNEMLKKTGRVAKSTIVEGFTEGAQTALEQIGAGRELDLDEIIEAGVKGAAGAGPLSLSGEALSRPTPEIDQTIEQQAEAQANFEQIQKDLAIEEEQGLPEVEIDPEMKTQEVVEQTEQVEDAIEKGEITEVSEQQRVEAEEGGIPTEAGRSDSPVEGREVTQEEVQQEAEVTEEVTEETQDASTDPNQPEYYENGSVVADLGNGLRVERHGFGFYVLQEGDNRLVNRAFSTLDEVQEYLTTRAPSSETLDATLDDTFAQMDAEAESDLNNRSKTKTFGDRITVYKDRNGDYNVEVPDKRIADGGRLEVDLTKEQAIKLIKTALKRQGLPIKGPTPQLMPTATEQAPAPVQEEQVTEEAPPVEPEVTEEAVVEEEPAPEVTEEEQVEEDISGKEKPYQIEPGLYRSNDMIIEKVGNKWEIKNETTGEVIDTAPTLKAAALRTKPIDTEVTEEAAPPVEAEVTEEAAPEVAEEPEAADPSAKPDTPPPSQRETSLEKMIVAIENRYFTKRGKFKAGTDAETKQRYADHVAELNKLKAERGALRTAPETLTEEETKALQREKVVEEAVRPLVNFIRAGKINIPEGLRGTTGVAEAWNGALEVTAQAIEGGAKLADAIAKGVREMKRSDWYKGLKGGKKREAIDTFKANVNMQLTQEYKKTKTTIQRNIDRQVGVTRERNQIKMDEYVLLKEKIKTLARGFREGARDTKKQIREAQKAVRDFVRKELSPKVIEGSPITKSELNKINRLIAEAADKPENIDLALRTLDQIFIDKAKVAKRRDIGKRLKKALSFQRVSGVKQQKKLGAKQYSLIETSKILYENDTKAADQKIKRLDRQIKSGKLSEDDLAMAKAERRALEFAGNREQAMIEMEMLANDLHEQGLEVSVEDAYTLELLNMVGGADMTLAQLEAVDRNLYYMIESGRTFRQAQKLQQEQSIQSSIEQALDVLTGSGEKQVLTEEERDTQQRAWDRFSNALKSFRNIQESLPTLMESLSRFDKKSKPFQSFLNQLVNRVADADIQKGISMNNIYEGIFTKAQEIFGRDYSDVIERNSKTKDITLTIQKRPETSQLRAETPIQTEETTRSGRPAFKPGAETEQVTNRMSIAQAMHYWQIWQQGDLNNDPSIKKTFQKMGWTEQTIAEIEDFITEGGKRPQNLEWAQWQMDEFYSSYYPRINAVYKRLYGFDLPFVDNYVPTFRKVGGKDTDINLMDTQTYQAAVANGSLKSRVPNTETFQKMSADDLMLQHVQRMEHFIHNSEVVNEFRKVFMNQKVTDAIEQIHGKNALNTIRSFMDDMARGSTDPKLNIKALNILMRNFVTAKIGINIPVFAKQLTSWPAYMSGVEVKDLGKYGRYTAEFFTDPVGNWKELMENSDYMQKRYTDSGFNQVLADAAEDMKKKGFNPKKLSLRDKMMVFTKLGDKTAIILGGYGYYKVQLDKYMQPYEARVAKLQQQLKNATTTKEKQELSAKLDEATKQRNNFRPKAKKQAIKDFETQTRLNQQSSELTDLSWIQRSGSFGKMFTMFQNSPLQYLRMEMAAITNLFTNRGNRADNIKNLMIYHFVLPGLFQAMASGFTGSDEGDWWRTFGLGSLAYLFIAGDVAENAWDAATKSQGWGMSNYVTALNTQLKKALADVTELRTLELESLSLWDTVEATKDGLILMGDLMGVPVNNVLRYGEGIYDLSTGRSDNYWRVAGWSDYALGNTHRKTDEMGLVKRNINRGNSRWRNLEKEAKEFFGDEYEKKEKGLKKLHTIYTEFGLDNPDVNYLMNKAKKTPEKARYLKELEEEMGRSAFRRFMRKLKKTGVVSKQLEKAFEELD